MEGRPAGGAALTLLKGRSLTQSFVFRDSRRLTVPGVSRQDAGLSYRMTIFKKRVTLTIRKQYVTNLPYWDMTPDVRRAAHAFGVGRYSVLND